MYERLTRFIDVFEGKEDFVKDYISWTFVEYIDDVQEFEKVMYDGFIDCDYLTVIGRLTEDHNAHDIDIPALNASEVLSCLTWAIRAERFCTGALGEALTSGFITSCLKRLRELDVTA